MRGHHFVAAYALAACALAACASDDQPAQRSIAQASTSQCGSQFVEGIDVYSGTGTIDWTKVKAAGRDFAFIKATQGDYNRQSTFATDWANSAAAGVLRSAYHFFDPTKDGVAQANYFLAELAAAGGQGSGDLPPMLDIECPVSSSQSTATSAGPNCEYTGNSGWVDSATMQQRIFDWLNTVEAAIHRKPILYSYPSWFGDVAFTDTRLTGYPLFIATYATCASVPAPWTTAVFWQYSDTGTVSGVPSQVDEDRFFGSAGDLMTWNTPPTPPMTDAGVTPTDDAPGGGPHHTGGCGCRSDGGAPVPLALALVIGARICLRRRRRS